MGIFKRVYASLGLALGLLALGATDLKAQNPTTFDGVLEAAKKEGTVVVWITSPARPETHQALIEAFNKRFGTSIRVQWLPTGQSHIRIIAEAEAGRGNIDVGFGQLEDVQSLRARKLVETYPWEQVFSKELPGIKEALDRTLPELRGMTMDLVDTVYGVAWNTNLIKDADVPNKLSGFLDPKWKGKFALNSYFLNPFPLMNYIEGEEPTLDFIKKVLEQKPVLERGTPATTRAISVGQAQFGMSTFHSAKRSTDLGEPVKFKLLEDYIFIAQSSIYVPNNAPHPNAGRLFAAWLATEGNAVGNKFETVPLLGTGITAVDQMIKDQVAAHKTKIAAPQTIGQLEKQGALEAKVFKLLSGQSN
jgi:iron(III) transport system substrate-binding protein